MKKAKKWYSNSATLFEYLFNIWNSVAALLRPLVQLDPLPVCQPYVPNVEFPCAPTYLVTACNLAETLYTLTCHNMPIINEQISAYKCLVTGNNNSLHPLRSKMLFHPCKLHQRHLTDDMYGALQSRITNW